MFLIILLFCFTTMIASVSRDVGASPPTYCTKTEQVNLQNYINVSFPVTNAAIVVEKSCTEHICLNVFVISKANHISYRPSISFYMNVSYIDNYRTINTAKENLLFEKTLDVGIVNKPNSHNINNISASSSISKTDAVNKQKVQLPKCYFAYKIKCEPAAFYSC